MVCNKKTIYQSEEKNEIYIKWKIISHRYYVIGAEKRFENSKILPFRILNKINIHYKYNLNLMKL